MNSKNKYSLKMDLSKLPTDVLPYISAHLIDSTILDESLRSKRADSSLILIYYINFFAKIYQKMRNNTINF